MLSTRVFSTNLRFVFTLEAGKILI